jgi:hypothetical protein
VEHLRGVRADGAGVVALVALPAHRAVDEHVVVLHVVEHVELRGVPDLCGYTRARCHSSLIFVVYIGIPDTKENGAA